MVEDIDLSAIPSEAVRKQIQTTRKLGVNFYAYLLDRITGAKSIQPLADLITLAAGNFASPSPS